jgi:cobyrinic acid a,c-diamide synthase
VILNRIGGARHEAVVRQSIETACGVPVLGALPRMSLGGVFPERHLGLLPPQEHEQVATPIAAAAAAVEEFLDLDALQRIAREAPAMAEVPPDGPGTGVEPGAAAVVRIGVFRDAAFQFYYPENLEALTAAGAEVVDISPIGDPELRAVDALYIGGGFPETLAPQLSANGAFREQLRARIEDGLPVYAECGGTVYLGERLTFEGREHPMVGALPLAFGFGKKPQGHGYVEVETVAENPYYAIGERLRGHEFHYTYVETGSRPSATELPFAFRVRTGFGVDGEHDGFCRRNVLASYTHVHALGVPGWAPALVRRALEFRSGR